MAKIYKRATLANGVDEGEFEGYPVTPNDTAATYKAQLPYKNGQPRACQGVYVTGAGNVAMVLNAAGDTALLTVAANTLIVCEHLQINATSTTATGLIALVHRG